MKTWTERDIAILRKEYPYGSHKKMERLLKRSFDTISTKAKRMKIRRCTIPNLNSKNGMWKGNKVGYTALHYWVQNHKPKSKLCEKCNKVPPYDLANISGKYKRNIKDYKWLCRRCHMKTDGRLIKWINMNYSRKKK